MYKPVAFLLSIFAASFSLANADQAVTWDFSRGHDRSTVNWPAAVDGEYLYLKELTVHAKIGNREFTTFAPQLECRSEGKVLEYVKIDTPDESLDDVSKHAQALIKEWSMIGQNFSDWQAGAAKGDQSTYDTHSRGDPSFNLTIAPSADDKKPWHIVFMIYWKEAPK